MANVDEDDVIELGSSDEETEPAPKKRRPTPNAMVHIPSKLPGVTIKPASKPKINPVSIANASIGKGITVTKISSGNKLSNPFATKNKQNGKPTVRKQIVTPHPAIPIINPNLTITPALKKIQKVAVTNLPLKVVKGIITAPTLIRPLPQGTLPPGITVKRTSQLRAALKPNIKLNPAKIQVKKKYHYAATKKAQTGEMVCVNLDDDDASQSSMGPQWYLRPEEQEKTDKSTVSVETSTDLEEKTSEVGTGKTEKEMGNTVVEKGTSDLQEQNNKEPETPNYIEITIEDSPAKLQSKRTCELAELAITIDDSPVKGVANKPAPGSASGSDEETTASKEKNSKKKLDYPKTVEIEIDLTPVTDPGGQNDDKTDSQDNAYETEIVEIVESPLKPAESFLTSTPKKKILPKPQLKIKSVHVPKAQSKLIENKTVNPTKSQPKLNEKETITSPSTSGEFHPVYQRFIDLCFKIENSEDMRKIVEKKVIAYYKQVPKEYTDSEMFIDMVASKVNAMTAAPEKMYLYIKDVVDELNLQRKSAKSQPVKLDTVNEEQDKFLYGEESEFDSKRQRQIRKLEKTLKKLHRAIQKLEEQEVDFDDEEDSVYLLTERYKERMIRVHAKFCQLTNTKMPSEPRVQIDARPGQHKGPAKRLEKWINKKVPIGSPLPFPDFHDVLRCVRDANQDDKLGWNEADIMEEARDLFTRCGKKLQRRRQENEWRLAASRIQSELDPAEASEELKMKLENNRREASKKESEVLNKYADRQNRLNLEAVEIGDKEADESPVETDDDEPTEEKTSLETKAKRKERLKRLLQEKSKKVTNTKEKPCETENPDNDNAEAKGVKETEDPEEKSKDLNRDMGIENNEKDPLADKQNDEEKDPLAGKVNKEKSDSENIHSLSDDSNIIDSDIDELHLLQKLHSDVIDSSTLESSDSESPIAISDTLSSGDNRKQASDVISIENSSYSESEKNNEQEYEIVSYSQKKIVTESVNVQMEIECSSAGVEKKINKSNNDEYTESVEDILLASSDEETNNSNEKSRGDPIAINETNVERKDKNKETSDENVINEASRLDSIEITVTKNMNSKAESAELTCIAITETETGDSDIITNAVETSISLVETVADEATCNVNDNAAEVTCMTSTESVEDETMTSIVEEIADKADEITNAKFVESVQDEITTSPNYNAPEVTRLVGEKADCVKSVETVEDEILTSPKETYTANKSNDTAKDETMFNLDERNETATKVNSVESAVDEITSIADDTNLEVKSVNSEVESTESVEDNVSTFPDESKDANDANTSSVVKSLEKAEADTINSEEHKGTYVDITDVNNKGSVEDSKGLSAGEPMEVDNDIDMT